MTQQREFGFWREYGPDYRESPSVRDFIVSGWTEPARERVVAYLTAAPVVACTSGFRCAVCGNVIAATVCYRTDGVWNWLDDLPHYITEHDVRPPDEMLEHMARVGFAPPADANT